MDGVSRVINALIEAGPGSLKLGCWFSLENVKEDSREGDAWTSIKGAMRIIQIKGIENSKTVPVRRIVFSNIKDGG